RSERSRLYRLVRSRPPNFGSLTQHIEKRWDELGAYVFQPHCRDTSDGRYLYIRGASHSTRELMPEGPGLTPFVATLPLKEGYVLNRYIVDRWEGHGDGRVKKTTLQVVRRAVVHSALGDVEAMELSIRPQDGSFDILEFVLARGLHWPVSMIYVRGNS